MDNVIEKGNIYFVAPVNSSKAYQFTSQYHYSHVGFKKAQVNLGVFENTTGKMVGCLQWGISAQEKIRLDRYVKEPITNKEYLELNRFCMADTEGKNAESQAISLGIKWIKKNLPQIKLLVSYAGRKEGNYGYIYQATNWEYLGYFVSPGFWSIDGHEKHQLTISLMVAKNRNPNLSIIENICELYQDVRQTWSKQFIYIQRLDKKLTPASAILPYPKPSNSFPIVEQIKIYKQNDKIFNNPIPPKISEKEFYYDANERLFSRRTLIRRGEECPKVLKCAQICRYDLSGKLIKAYQSPDDLEEDFKIRGVREAISHKKPYKSFYFTSLPFGMDVPTTIEVAKPICIIEDIPYFSQNEIIEAFGVSRQAVSATIKRKGKTLLGKKITWIE